ncbi:MAG: HEPN domain-containing protein [Chloroflexota bacterium]
MNEQIGLILAKAKESLEAARLLREEGYLDFAASRAYYAMFYTAEALLLSKNLSFSSHAAVIANYGKEFSKTGELDPKYHKPDRSARPS